MDDGRSMRAAKDSLAVPPEGEVEKIGRPLLGLMACLGKSIAKQSEGRAGENVARSEGLIRVILGTTYTSKQGAGDQVRFAPSPLVAPLRRRSERKPSGIPPVTVVPPVILQSVPAFLLRTPGEGPATTANIAERTCSPEGGEGSWQGARARR